MLNCKEITELASQSLDRKLNWREKWQFRLHLMMCRACTLYLKQLLFIKQTAGILDDHTSNVKLSSEARKRISKAINKPKPRKIS